jgi:hypothetical protein
MQQMAGNATRAHCARLSTEGRTARGSDAVFVVRGGCGFGCRSGHEAVGASQRGEPRRPNLCVEAVWGAAAMELDPELLGGVRIQEDEFPAVVSGLDLERQMFEQAPPTDEPHTGSKLTRALHSLHSISSRRLAVLFPNSFSHTIARCSNSSTVRRGLVDRRVRRDIGFKMIRGKQSRYYETHGPLCTSTPLENKKTTGVPTILLKDGRFGLG